MVGLSHVRGRSVGSSRSRTNSDVSKTGSEADVDEMVVEPDEGNVLSHLISQLRPGADLSRVTFPTFILEPKTMLERITNFMQHPDTLLPISKIEDPVDRFVAVTKMYLSGWHIRPPGVKKPLNPILGEIFTCYWDYPDGTRGYYISEQTSHHPPKSSYFYMAPEHHIRIDGTLKPRSRFLGNSAASIMEGVAFVKILNKGKNPGGEKYLVTQPNMYARGILFGKMKFELGDTSYIRCPENDLVAEIEFKTKGYFSGAYNAIGGTIKRESTGDVLFELSGSWVAEMFIKNVTTGQKDLLFDATHAKPSLPQVRPLDQQEERESRNLWKQVLVAIKNRDHVAATDEKTRIEEMQRSEAAQRQQDGEEWHPRLFRAVKTGRDETEDGQEGLDWILAKEISHSDVEKQTGEILSIVDILDKHDKKQALKKTNEGSQQAVTKENQPPQNQNHHAAEDDMATPIARPINPYDQPASHDATAAAAAAMKGHSNQERSSSVSKVLHKIGHPAEAIKEHEEKKKKSQAEAGAATALAHGKENHPAAATTEGNHVSAGAATTTRESEVTNDMAKMRIHRTDTGTSSLDEFVDAEE